MSMVGYRWWQAYSLLLSLDTLHPVAPRELPQCSTRILAYRAADIFGNRGVP